MLLSKRFFVVSIISLLLIAGIVGFFLTRSGSKQEFALSSLSVVSKVSKLLPLEEDTKKEIAAVDKLSQAVFKKDGVLRTYLVLLQNNHELRPGGGFLGQYAVVKIKDGEVVSTFVEDTNLLDQRINIKVTPPYPLTRKLQLKRWEMRDSNFSPDFPTNAEKAKYFYRLAGGGQKFDGVIAINASILDDALAISGPISASFETFDYINNKFVQRTTSETFNSTNGVMLLEEVVEKKFLINESKDIEVPAELKQKRKNVMKVLANELVKRLTTVENIPKAIELARQELTEKNIMLNFTDAELQSVVADVKWGGVVNTSWTDDYLMLVDANLGALKSDHYVKRSIDYLVDFTGEKPVATLTHHYNHTATRGDWRTSDYHTYLRAYVPKGSTLIERQLVSYPLTDEAFGRTYFGVFVDAVMNKTTSGMIKYQLPDTIKPENYKLLIEKQSGVGTIPVTVTIKTKDKEIKQTADLKKDLILSLQEVEEKK